MWYMCLEWCTLWMLASHKARCKRWQLCLCVFLQSLHCPGRQRTGQSEEQAVSIASESPLSTFHRAGPGYRHECAQRHTSFLVKREGKYWCEWVLIETLC
eukprot:jgi/Ulvmu1/3262/UM151_0010.1